MPRGGYRPCSGRKKKSETEVVVTKEDVSIAAAKSGMSPLEYMLAIMNDETVDGLRRDRMAVAAAPYVHPKVAEEKAATRKEEKQALAEERVAGGGRFSAPTPPHEMMN